MKKLFGNTAGLKPSQIRRLENLYRRRVPVQLIVTPEIARDISRISRDIGRQVGLLVNRQGQIIHVIVGDHHGIVIPDSPAYRTVPGRLKGLRCIHTHLKNEALTQDDLTDLSLLRLDIMAAVTANSDGTPGQVHMAHILPEITARTPYRMLPPANPWEMDIGCLSLIQALESEIDRAGAVTDAGSGTERALLVSVTTASRKVAMDSLDELRELARSARIRVVDTVLQKRKRVDSRFLMGSGKITDLSVTALRHAVSLIIFDQELNASQIRSITDSIAIKVIDRTQLILDIFAQRAQTREGRLQVELAQLKYLLPRLVTKNTAMSRLTGGIGGRGPGETKLEVNRRRARTRIAWLEQAISAVRKQRKLQKKRRNKRGLPVISIIGYTNAGKSTLLNTLTKSRVRAENRLFATLDPSSRRLKFPEDMEVIVTDTVGFIRDLPQDLMVAFRATLEELEGADLLLHVIDAANPRFADQIDAVERILADLHLSHIPCIRVLNKKDRVDSGTMANYVRTYNGTAVSAPDRSTLRPLIEKMAGTLRPFSRRQGVSPALEQ